MDDKKRLALYDSMVFGIDVGFKDGTGVMIATPFKETIYALHNTVYPQGTGVQIKLRDLVDRIEIDNFVNAYDFLKEED